MLNKILNLFCSLVGHNIGDNIAYGNKTTVCKRCDKVLQIEHKSLGSKIIVIKEMEQ